MGNVLEEQQNDVVDSFDTLDMSNAKNDRRLNYFGFALEGGLLVIGVIMMTIERPEGFNLTLGQGEFPPTKCISEYISPLNQSVGQFYYFTADLGSGATNATAAQAPKEYMMQLGTLFAMVGSAAEVQGLCITLIGCLRAVQVGRTSMTRVLFYLDQDPDPWPEHAAELQAEEAALQAEEDHAAAEAFDSLTKAYAAEPNRSESLQPAAIAVPAVEPAADTAETPANVARSPLEAALAEGVAVSTLVEPTTGMSNDAVVPVTDVLARCLNGVEDDEPSAPLVAGLVLAADRGSGIGANASLYKSAVEEEEEEEEELPKYETVSVTLPRGKDRFGLTLTGAAVVKAVTEGSVADGRKNGTRTRSPDPEGAPPSETPTVALRGRSQLLAWAPPRPLRR